MNDSGDDSGQRGGNPNRPPFASPFSFTDLNHPSSHGHTRYGGHRSEGDTPFSLYLGKKYGSECFAVDPTRKHAAALRKLEETVPGFNFLPVAVGAKTGTTEFFESNVNISGSLMSNHRNVRNDPGVSYQVEVLSINDLLKRVGCRKVALLKLDIEGAEFDLLNSLRREHLRPIAQILVEFHHDTVVGYTETHFREVLRHMSNLGMTCHVYDGRDCLFYWDVLSQLVPQRVHDWLGRNVEK